MLAAIASVTKKLILGCGTVISHRHPIHLAQCMAGLSTIANGRVIMGIGAGTFAHEFSAAGLPSTDQDRFNLAKVNSTLLRRLWSGEKVDYEDQYFSFKDVELKPTPVEPIPIWYGGEPPLLAGAQRIIVMGGCRGGSL